MRLVLHGCVKDGHLFTGRLEGGPSTLGSRGQLITQAHIGEGAAHHHLVVTTAGTVGVEVDFLDALALEILSSRRVLFDRSGRRNVIRGNGITKPGQAAGVSYFGNAGEFLRHSTEIGRVLNVGGIILPAEHLTLGEVDAVPALVAFEHA